MTWVLSWSAERQLLFHDLPNLSGQDTARYEEKGKAGEK